MSQEEEQLALSAIYDESECTVDANQHTIEVRANKTGACVDSPCWISITSTRQIAPCKLLVSASALTLQIKLNVRGRHVTLRAHLPEAYPSTAPPLAEVDGPDVTPHITQRVLALLDELFAPGESVLYAWAEAVREHLECSLPRESDGEDAAVAAAATIAADEEEQHEQAGRSATK